MSPHRSQFQDDAPTEGDSNIIEFHPRRRQAPAEPLFTDAERVELRKMLREFQMVKESCPVARRLTQEE
jgi:hypothetical protein